MFSQQLPSCLSWDVLCIHLQSFPKSTQYIQQSLLCEELQKWEFVTSAFSIWSGKFKTHMYTISKNQLKYYAYKKLEYRKKLLTRPILSSRTTSSLLSSQRSLRMGFLNTAPDLPVTGRPLWYWCRISSCTVGNAGPSNRKWPCGMNSNILHCQLHMTNHNMWDCSTHLSMA